MLGYVKTDAQELRLREHQVYRALYCGLCHRMGKCTGNCSRMTLSYDFVFLAAVRLSLCNEMPTVEKRRCLLHPFRPRPTVAKCEALDYCADASALLVYRKLCDDIQDERGLKKLRACLTRPFLSSAYRRAKRRHPALNDEITRYLQTLSEYEKAADFPGAEALAEQFGLLMAAVFREGLQDDQARIAESMGHALGHWIYLVDAADDFSQDQKRGRFNPYLPLFGEEPTDADRENVRLSLTAHLCRMEQGLSLIDSYPIPELREILCNILYLGMPATGKRVAARLCRSPEKTKQKA